MTLLLAAVVCAAAAAEVWRRWAVPRPAAPRSGTIYLLHAPSIGACKIGWTGGRRGERPRSLIAAMPAGVPAVLVATWPGSVADEQALHARFAGLEMGVRGLPAWTEWFRVTPGEVLAYR